MPQYHSRRYYHTQQYRQDVARRNYVQYRQQMDVDQQRYRQEMQNAQNAPPETRTETVTRRYYEETPAMQYLFGHAEPVFSNLLRVGAKAGMPEADFNRLYQKSFDSLSKSEKLDFMQKFYPDELFVGPPAPSNYNTSFNLAGQTEAQAGQLPLGPREISWFGQSVVRFGVSTVKDLVGFIPGSDPLLKNIDRYFAVGSGLGTSFPWDRKRQTRDIASNLITVERYGNQELSPYFSRNPIVFGGGVFTETALIFTGGMGVGKAAGHLARMMPSAGSYIQGGLRAAQLYSGQQLVQGGYDAFQRGDIGRYTAYNAPGLLLGVVGFKQGMRQGELSGQRQRLLGNIKNDPLRTKLKLQFEGLDRASRLSSKNRTRFYPEKVLEFKSPGRQAALRMAMDDPLMRPYKNKLILAGSGSQSTYMKVTPKDIDLYVKNRFPRLKFIDTKGRSRLWDYRVTIDRPSRVAEVSKIFEKYGLKDVVDIHDKPRPGSSFSVLGSGYAERPIRAKSGLFKYQTRFSEQASRKIAQSISPEHLGRGKDWASSVEISRQAFRDPLFTRELERWMPALETGTSRLKGPSFYEKNIGLAPRTKPTFTEKLVRRYGKPVETKELYTPSTKWDPDTQAFRPQFVEKINPIVKGTVTRNDKIFHFELSRKGTSFFSSMLPVGKGYRSGGRLTDLFLVPPRGGSYSSDIRYDTGGLGKVTLDYNTSKTKDHTRTYKVNIPSPITEDYGLPPPTEKNYNYKLPPPSPKKYTNPRPRPPTYTFRETKTRSPPPTSYNITSDLMPPVITPRYRVSPPESEPPSIPSIQINYRGTYSRSPSRSEKRLLLDDFIEPRKKKQRGSKVGYSEVLKLRGTPVWDPFAQVKSTKVKGNAYDTLWNRKLHDDTFPEYRAIGRRLQRERRAG